MIRVETLRKTQRQATTGGVDQGPRRQHRHDMETEWRRLPRTGHGIGDEARVSVKAAQPSFRIGASPELTQRPRKTRGRARVTLAM